MFSELVEKSLVLEQAQRENSRLNQEKEAIAEGLQHNSQNIHVPEVSESQ